MYEINKLPPAITLGYQGESLVRTIEVDCADWLETYPAGTMAATILLPGYGDVAPLPVDMDGTVMRIPVTRGMTAKAGRGSINLRLLDGDVEKRSAVVPVYIQTSHPPVSGEMPDPVQDWVADATSKLAETIAATEAANEAAGLTTDAIARANEISETMEGIAPLWSDVDISVSALGEGAAPTASITQGETGTSISLGIPKGDTGAKGDKGNDGKPFNYRGDYNAGADPLYSKNDVVRFGGGSFVYINDVDSNEPTSSASHWQQIAEKGDIGPSAYDAAVAGGYTGTEAEFNAANAGIEAAKDAALDAADTANGAAQSADNARTSLTTEVGEALESIPAEVTAQINTRLGGLSLSVDPTDKGLNITYTY